MSGTATATADFRVSAVGQPEPPPPPATIVETGLHPDTLAQLMLKTLVNGEATGTGPVSYTHLTLPTIYSV